MILSFSYLFLFLPVRTSNNHTFRNKIVEACNVLLTILVHAAAVFMVMMPSVSHFSPVIIQSPTIRVVDIISF